ncbi:MAG TPA: hypothetical protein VMN57_06125 [Anaerolineales bacterium]|nr:hypothetical protein [Anaerolineales bacterium]
MTRPPPLAPLLIAAALFLSGCSPSQPAPTPAVNGNPTATFQPPPGSEEEAETGDPEPAHEQPDELGPGDPLDELSFRNGWARIPFNFTVFGGYGADQMNDVAAGGPGVVAVGFEVRDGDINAAAWYSPDALGWFRVTESPDLRGSGVQTINAVATGTSRLIAVGMEKIGDDENAAVWASTDGVLWTRIRAGNGVFGDTNSQVMEDVIAVGDGFVAVGVEKTDAEVRGAVWTSPDGTAWQRVPHSEGSFGGTTRFTTLKAIAPLGSSLLAVGSVEPVDDIDVDAAAWLSHDGGATWIPVDAPETSLGDSGPVRFQRVYGVVESGAGWFMVATEQNLAGSPSGEFVNGLIWHSSDGSEWSRIFDHKPDLYQQSMLDILASSLGLFAAGYEVLGDQVQAAVWFSEDGSTWSQTPRSEAVFGGSGIQHIRALAEAGPGIVAVGITTENEEQDAAVWIFVPGR